MTTTHTHTSGPWCIHRGYANAPTMTITGDDGERWEFTHTHIGQGDKIIAQVQHQSKDSGWPHVHDVEEMWANARLIAAAPELLQIAKDYVLLCQLHDIEGAVLDSALAAVAKVEGRGE